MTPTKVAQPLTDVIINEFSVNLRERGKEPATIESYSRDARNFLQYLVPFRLPYNLVEPETLIAYQDHLKGGKSERENSVRRSVIGIRMFYRFLTEKNYIKQTPFDCIPIPSRDERLPTTLKASDIESLIQSALKSHPHLKAMRDATIITLIAFEGIKAHELITLEWKDYLEDTLYIGGTRARAIKLGPQSIAFLAKYRTAFWEIGHPSRHQSSEKRMFCAFRGRDAAMTIPKMTRHGLKFVLYELGEDCKLPKINTEHLRHFAVTHLIECGKTTEEIMLHLGLRRIGNIAKHLLARQPHVP